MDVLRDLAQPFSLRTALQSDESGRPAKRVLAGGSLLAALRDGESGQIVDAHVVLGKLEAARTLRRLPEGLQIRGCLVVARLDGAALAFPPGLVVEGGLYILQGWFCRPTRLGALSFGRGLRVGGDMDIYGCPALTALPEGLDVGGDLLVVGSQITCLPDSLAVAGSLGLEECAALRSLPEGLCVRGDLRLNGCSALTNLPKGLQVGEDLILAGCSSLEALPEGLEVGGTLHLGNCHALEQRYAGEYEALARDLQAILCVAPSRGGLWLSGWKTLETLPSGLVLGGSLDLEGCSGLTTLPRDLCVGGDFRLSGCVALPALPEGIQIGGDLELRGCLALTTLPRGLRITGDLDLEGCSALTSLPSLLQVDGSLDLRNCAALSQLPEQGLQIGGSLDLSHCAALTSLPENLHLGGNLRASYCSALAAIPAGLHVGGFLVLEGCSALTSLHEDIRIGGYVDLEGCSSLESLPAAMLEWPVREDSGRPHDVVLSGSGLSPEALEWLREADAPGLRFHVDLGWGSLERPAFASTKEAAAFWAQEAGETDGLEPPEEDITLERFLTRLRDAKEFGIAETRKALAQRVVAVLKLLADDEHARDDLLSRMADSIDACGDKPVWALNQMHLVVETAKARGNAEALRALGKRVMRLMVVHEHAKRKVESLKWVDDVCVYLRFEIDLRESLDLPVAASAMVFAEYIQIEDEELEAAKIDALAITDKQFDAWLAQWPEWQRQARRDIASRLVWDELPERKRRVSLSRRLSRRLSRLVGMTGDVVRDPVQLSSGGAVWGMGDLLRHWERTGMDLHNSVVSPEQMESSLRRVT